MLKANLNAPEQSSASRRLSSNTSSQLYFLTHLVSLGVVSAKVHVKFVSSHESITHNREIHIWVFKLVTFSLIWYRNSSVWFAFNVLCYKTYRPVFYRGFRFDALTSTEDIYLHLLRQVNIRCLTNFFLAVIPERETYQNFFSFLHLWLALFLEQWDPQWFTVSSHRHILLCIYLLRFDKLALHTAWSIQLSYHEDHPFLFHL